jgi:hypothetical protein
LSSGGVHASNYMKQIIIIRQASEWVSYGHHRPKIQRHRTEPSWTSPNFKRILSHFDVKLFHCDLSNMHLCTAWMYMFGMNKWTFSFFPRRKYNIIIYNRHPPTGGGTPWRMNEKWIIKKNPVFCWVSVIFNIFAIFICCIIGYYP